MMKEENLMAERKREDDMKEAEKENQNQNRSVFFGLCFYINGSTGPLVSDHKLKHLLAENGARVAVHLSRRNVTHVILGKPGTRGSGAGGSLAASKIQKEIQRGGASSVKYIGVEW
jgi:hypothetical protein